MVFNKNKVLRILHAPSPDGGQAWSLSRAERKLGQHSEHMVYISSKFGYLSDIDLHISRYPKILSLVVKVIFFFRALISYNVFHFYSANSLLPFYIDLPILRFFKKRIIMTFQGSDIRKQKMEYRLNDTYFLLQRPYKTQNSDQSIDKKVKLICHYANKTYVLNPDLISASPSSEFLPYANVDVHRKLPQFPTENGAGIIKIVHAPSKRDTKGTSYILAAISNLKVKGFPISFKLLENISFTDVERASNDADIAIDQLLIGWYGGFSVEMMAMGKPVVCYIDSRLKPLVPYFDQLPIINASKENIEQVLATLISQRKSLREIGVRSRNFVLAQHDPEKIAQNVISSYL